MTRHFLQRVFLVQVILFFWGYTFLRNQNEFMEIKNKYKYYLLIN